MQLHDKPVTLYDPSGAAIGPGHREYRAVKLMHDIDEQEAQLLLEIMRRAMDQPEKYFRQCYDNGLIGSVPKWKKAELRQYQKSGKKSLKRWIDAEGYDPVWKVNGRVAKDLRKDFVGARNRAFRTRRNLMPLTSCFYDIGMREQIDLFNTVHSDYSVQRIGGSMAVQAVCELIPGRLVATLQAGRTRRIEIQAYNRGTDYLELRVDISDEPSITGYKVSRTAGALDCWPFLKIDFSDPENPVVKYLTAESEPHSDGCPVKDNKIFRAWRADLCLVGGTQLERLIQWTREENHFEEMETHL